MFRFFKPYLKSAILAAILKMGESVSDLTLPLIMAKIIDIGVKNKDLDYIIKNGYLMIGIAFLGYSSAILSNYFSSKTSQEFGANLRKNIFIKIQYFSFKQLNKFSQASLITRLTKDVDQVTNMFLMSIRMVLRGVTTGVGAVVMAILIDPVLAIIFLFIAPFISFLTFYYMKKSSELYEIVQNKLDNLTSVLRENLSGLKVIKALSKEKIEKSKFRNWNEQLKADTTEADAVMISKLPLITLTVNLGVVAVLWFGGIRVNIGKIKVGEVVAFINYLNMILFAMNALSFLFVIYSRASVSFGRIKEVVEENVINYPEERLFTSKAMIEFRNVYFSYDETENYTLKDINFKINKGENIGIIGSIGSGKTTLLSLITKFYPPTSGKINVQGDVGLVFQKAFLFSQTVKENLSWGKPTATHNEIDEVTILAQAKEFIEKLPDKFDTTVLKGGNNFSGGQKQRLSIARTLLKKSDILIFDDSFSALDFITEANLKKDLRNYIKDITMITVSSKVSSLIQMDKILVMDSGKIVGFDTHKNLLKNCLIYQEICESQDIQTGGKFDEK